MRKLVAATLCLMSASQAHAFGSLGPMPGEERFVGLLDNKDDENAVGGGVGFGQIGKDFFLTITPRLDLNFGPFGIGLQGPVALRLSDQSPDPVHPLRQEDWDEPSDFLKFVRYVRWGQKRDFIFVRVGELAASIGHGTIMDRYLNTTDINTFHLGLQADLNTSYFGVETMISDLGMFGGGYDDARVMGARVYIKPVSFFDPSSFLNIFSIGGTVVVDENAPAQLATVQPDPADPASRRVILDENGNFTVRCPQGVANCQDGSTRAMVVGGFDVEAEIFNNAFIELIPYMDVNFVHQGDAGFHLGAQAKIKIPILIDLAIPIKLEYRYVGNRYIPTYFNNFYELERYNYSPDAVPAAQYGLIAPTDGVPKAVAMALGRGGGGSGLFGDAAFDIAGYIQVGAMYEHYDGSVGGNLAIYANIPAIEWLQAKAYYARTGIKDPADAFQLDERSLLVAQAAYEIVSYIWIVGRAGIRWEAFDPAATPGYTPPQGVPPPEVQVREVFDWNIGLEFSYEF